MRIRPNNYPLSYTLIKSKVSNGLRYWIYFGITFVTAVGSQAWAAHADTNMADRSLRVIRFMTDAARREQETMKKKATPKLSLSITGGVSRNSTATPPRHTSGNLTPPVTPPITPSSSFRSSTPTGTTGVCVLKCVLETKKDGLRVPVEWMGGVGADYCKLSLLAVTEEKRASSCSRTIRGTLVRFIRRTDEQQMKIYTWM